MSYLGLQFLAKTPELVVQQRIRLNWYANLAQASQLTIHLVILLYNLIDPALVGRLSGSHQNETLIALFRIKRSVNTRLRFKVGKQYGTYGQWIFGLTWAWWLAYLCIAETWPGIISS